MNVEKLEELMFRMATGETLQGEEAQTVMGLATDDAPWQLWVYVAIGYLDLNQVGNARYVLERLLEREGGKPSDWC